LIFANESADAMGSVKWIRRSQVRPYQIEMTPMLREIYSHMNSRRRVQLFVVLFLMLAGAMAEMFTLGAVVPFLGLLVNPDLLDKHSSVSYVLGYLANQFSCSKLLAASAVFVIFAVLAAALRLVLSWFSLRFVFAVGSDFGRDIYANTLQQPYIYHTQRNSSEMLASIEKVTSLVAGIMMPGMQMIIAIVMTIAMLGAMLWVDFKTSMAAALLFGSMYGVISVWSKTRLRANSEVIASTGTLKIKAVQEGLGSIRDVIIEGNHDIYAQHFGVADRAQRTAQANNAILSSAPKYVVESAGMIMIVALAYVLTISNGADKSIPILGALAIGAQRLLPYMQSIYNGIAALRSSAASARDALNLLNLKPRAQTAPASELATPSINGLVIELRNVEFQYPNTARKTLEGVSLQIKTGEKIGFVGQTGSGKSTLIDIIMGLLPPASGELVAYGTVLDEHNMQHWQNRIAHVPQAIFLSDTSIAENIALGTPKESINPHRLSQAVEQAQLTDFIQSLPMGIETRVGERGVQLSGGQRQRIGIARALYKNADVLVLDEATSALDNETEARVMESIYTLRPDLVVLMIAHRLSTLEGCQRIFELNHGKITEHASLDAFKRT
jgi:ATP-binding cassette, subfamily B, bacterial PglK